MENNKTYAVVDIETTGTDMHEPNRIIQFSCVLVKDNKVFSKFVTDVNPLREVPFRISELTGIKQSRLLKAPTFDQVAGKIFALLQGTVFVAHNVNFDFPFLNREFQRVGFPVLENTAIDTVTLSQILLPTLSSYRLKDISSYFNIVHKHPHSADSDALATAKLLLILKKEVHQLPLITLKQILQVNPSLPRDTMDVFRLEVHDRQKKEIEDNLANQLLIVGGLVLRKQSRPQNNQRNRGQYKYPKNKRAKAKVLPSRLESRSEQNKMMNIIYNNYSATDQHEERSLIIEAPTGVGKTLGYCLPFSYLVSENKPLVISTSTNYLQFQLKNQTIPILNEELPFHISSVILKGSRHYLDLDRFKNLLFSEDGLTQTAFVKAQLLVWLTITQTGDLDEMHLNIDQTPFVSRIQHQGLQSLSKRSVFFEYDFLRLNYQRAKKADFIIVNHSFLLYNQQLVNLKEGKPYLVIDETQQFSEQAVRSSEEKISFLNLVKQIREVNDLGFKGRNNLKDILESNKSISSLLENIFDHNENLLDLIDDLFKNLFKQFIVHQSLHNRNNTLEKMVNPSQLKIFTQANAVQIGELNLLIINLKNDFQRIEQILSNDILALTKRDKLVVYEFVDAFNNSQKSLQKLNQIFNNFNGESNEHVFWLGINSNRDPQTLVFHWSLLDTKTFLQNQVYDHFEQPTFTGATIFTSKRSQFTYDSLGLNKENTAIRRLKNNQNDENMAKIFVPNDLEEFRPEVQSDQYIEQIAGSIERIYSNQPRQTMVLFNSLKIINLVYQRLKDDGFTAKNYVLAQDVDGTSAKISKLFIRHEPTILLGANTFWQGVDFPNHLLENLIIAQLPFDNPTEPYNRALHALIKKQGKNPFYSITVPKATLRLRQGIGRLLRTKNDYGVVWVLDNRLINKRYGEVIINNLRTSIPIVKESFDQSLEEMNNFYKIHDRGLFIDQ